MCAFALVSDHSLATLSASQGKCSAGIASVCDAPLSNSPLLPACPPTQGAGNVSSINVSDVINKALLEGCVCCLKLNPVNEYVGPSVERALAPLIERGALRVVYGGGPVGKALVEHPLVDSVHMTGSDRTYDAVVWQGKPKARCSLW